MAALSPRVASRGSNRSAESDVLDFSQAMADFQRMFPNVERDIIEEVLRTNKGGVDDTIDQLLMLCMDDDHQETVPKHYAQVPKSVVGDPPVTNGRVATNIACESEPPPPYHVVASNRKQQTSPRRSSGSDSHPFNPPLVGRLPTDFLSVDRPSPSGAHSAGSRVRPVDPTTDALDGIYEELERKNRLKREKVEKARSIANQTTHLGVFSTTSSSSSSAAGGLSPRRRRANTADLAGNTHGTALHSPSPNVVLSPRQQSEYLKDLMIDNEFKRQVADDPELIRYLEDERVAIMLQNREFVKTLRRNRDFMSALEREARPVASRSQKVKPLRRSIEDERVPVPDGPPVAGESKKFWRRKSKTTSAQSPSANSGGVPDGPQLDPIVNDLVCLEDTANEPRVDARHVNPSTSSPNDPDGYGRTDAVGSVDPFPYTRRVPNGEDEDEEVFARKLRNMGKLSKQKFALMARRFGRKTQGAPGILSNGFDDDAHYSGTHLLESTDDFDAILPNDHRTNYAYNQPTIDGDYGIGQRVDLNKQGRLFGNR